jgi:hypothetical protein
MGVSVCLTLIHPLMIPPAVRFKVQVCSRLIVGIADSNPAKGMGCSSLVLLVCCVGNGFFDELITRSEVSYLVCV